MEAASEPLRDPGLPEERQQKMEIQNQPPAIDEALAMLQRCSLLIAERANRLRLEERRKLARQLRASRRSARIRKAAERAFDSFSFRCALQAR